MPYVEVCYRELFKDIVKLKNDICVPVASCKGRLSRIMDTVINECVKV